VQLIAFEFSSTGQLLQPMALASSAVAASTRCVIKHFDFGYHVKMWAWRFLR